VYYRFHRLDELLLYATIQRYFSGGIGFFNRLMNNVMLKLIFDQIQIMQFENYYPAATAPGPALSTARIPHRVLLTIQVAAVSSGIILIVKLL
jgi:hypothetical protein